MVHQSKDAGARYLHLDSKRYTHLVSDEGRDNPRGVGMDPSGWLKEMIAVDHQLVDT